jgi:hypothetical protein
MLPSNQSLAVAQRIRDALKWFDNAPLAESGEFEDQEEAARRFRQIAVLAAEGSSTSGQAD